MLVLKEAEEPTEVFLTFTEAGLTAFSVFGEVPAAKATQVWGDHHGTMLGQFPGQGMERLAMHHYAVDEYNYATGRRGLGPGPGIDVDFIAVEAYGLLGTSYSHSCYLRFPLATAIVVHSLPFLI